MRIVRKLIDMLRFARYGSTRVQGIEERLPALEKGLPALGDRLDARFAEAQAQVAASQRQFTAMLAQAQADQAQSLRELAEAGRRDMEALRSQISALAAGLDRAYSNASRESVPPSATAAEQGFYPLLEAAFRGSEADVKQRMSAYRDAVDAMPAGPVADLGCGRGEWLELLASWGREAIGVESNALVAADVRARGTRVEQGDALAWLQSQREGSFSGVTAFHLVEHLPFGVLLRLFMEAHRVLAPGGTLIVETPNPENLAVATQTFWLDPTHLRPLPAALLELAARYCGFAKLTVLRLHPPETGDGPGRDYALIATKAVAQ